MQNSHTDNLQPKGLLMIKKSMTNISDGKPFEKKNLLIYKIIVYPQQK